MPYLVPYLMPYLMPYLVPVLFGLAPTGSDLNIDAAGDG